MSTNAVTHKIVNSHTVLELAEAVAVDGPDRHEVALTELVETARGQGRCPEVILDVVADAGAPAVARQRALGRLVAALVPVGSPSRQLRSAPVPAPIAARSEVHELRWSTRWLWQQ